MGTRFGRKVADGTTEYYDTRQQLEAAVIRERQEGIVATFGFAGLLIGGLLTYVLIHKVGGAQWPKVLRFSAVLLGAGLTSYVLIKFADAILTAMAVIVGTGILFGIGALIWHFV